MSDLIERLRQGPLYDYDGLKAYKLMQEAIDALEAKDKRIAELAGENEHLCDVVETHIEGIKVLQARVETLEGAIRWALGESPEGMPEFPLIGEPPYYRWRTQLRLLADLPYIAATEQGESDE